MAYFFLMVLVLVVLLVTGEFGTFIEYFFYSATGDNASDVIFIARIIATIVIIVTVVLLLVNEDSKNYREFDDIKGYFWILVLSALTLIFPKTMIMILWILFALVGLVLIVGLSGGL